MTARAMGWSAEGLPRWLASQNHQAPASAIGRIGEERISNLERIQARPRDDECISRLCGRVAVAPNITQFFVSFHLRKTLQGESIRHFLHESFCCCIAEWNVCSFRPRWRRRE